MRTCAYMCIHVLQPLMVGPQNAEHSADHICIYLRTIGTSLHSCVVRIGAIALYMCRPVFNDSGPPAPLFPTQTCAGLHRLSQAICGPHAQPWPDFSPTRRRTGNCVKARATDGCGACSHGRRGSLHGHAERRVAALVITQSYGAINARCISGWPICGTTLQASANMCAPDRVPPCRVWVSAGGGST